MDDAPASSPETRLPLAQGAGHVALANNALVATSADGKVTVHLPWRDVVGVDVEGATGLVVHAYPGWTTAATSARRYRAVRLVADADAATVADFAARACLAAGVLRGAAAEGGEPRRLRWLVLVNPFGGKKQAMELFETHVLPVARMAHVGVDVRTTEYAGHARDLVRECDLSVLDCLVIVSGDGLLNEVIDGLSKRKDAEAALATPLAIVPGGSGNGIAWSIGAGEAASAGLTALKGSPQPLDLLEARQAGDEGQPDDVYVGCLSIEWALIADIDVESEELRWMGGARFTAKAVQKVMGKPKVYAGHIEFWRPEMDPAAAGVIEDGFGSPARLV